MIDNYLKVLESLENFPQKMQQIIEGFVSFYSEDKRKKITDKFSNSVVIPYIPLDQLKTMISQIKKEKTKELVQKFKERTNVNDEMIEKFFPSFSSFDENIFVKYYNDIVDIKEHGKDFVDYSIRTLDSDITVENILADNKTELMKMMEEFKPLIDELMVEYSDFYKRIEKYDKMCSVDYYKANNDVLYQFAEEHKELLGDEYEKIEQEYTKHGYVSSSNYPKLKNYIGSLTNPVAPIFSFDEVSEEKLKNPKSTYEKESIYDDRIKYFKMMGIDLGSDYSNYENDERCKKIWPTKELIDYLKKEKEKYIKLYNQKIFEQYPIYVQYKKVIDGIPFMEEIDTVGVFMQGLTAVSPNFVKKDGEICSLPLVFLNLSREINGLDMNIIHEFNHLYELESLSLTDDEYHIICGWDIIDGDYKTINDDLGNREFELFNEIVNDLIAETICKGMHAKGEYLITSPGEENYRTAGYRRTEFLIKPFITTFGKNITKTREGDINELFNLVGKENVDEFCKLFVEYNKFFGGLKILKWAEAVKKGEENELTEKRKEIEIKRDEIIEKMKEYSLNLQQKKTM